MKNSKSYNSFTVCNVAYLHKALVLSDSYFKVTNKKLFIYIIDTKRELPDLSDHHEIIWIEDIEFPNFNQLAFKYDITELSTSLKPFIAQLNLLKYDKVIFFDPDIHIYSPINKIINYLDDNSILLTPHYVNPEPNEWDNSDLGMMRFGSFNLGFFAVSRSDESKRFLEWWHDRCMRLCYFETQFGLSTDQKWVSIAPCFFKDIKVCFNLGFNMSFWNLHERIITSFSDNLVLINKKEKLVFFHFSSFNEMNPSLLSTRPVLAKNNINSNLKAVATDYSNKHNKYKKIIPNKKYGYDYMNDGSYISPTFRRAYASVQKDFPENHNPFNAKGEVGTFGRKNYLFSKKDNFYIPEGYNDISKHKQKMKFIIKGMRIILKILGPNKFMNFSRLLIYLSSYRQNRDLWKFK